MVQSNRGGFPLSNRSRSACTAAAGGTVGVHGRACSLYLKQVLHLDKMRARDRAEREKSHVLLALFDIEGSPLAYLNMLR